MKKLFIALMLVAFPAFAIDVPMPEGCYVAYSNPTYCHDIEGGNTLIWTQSTDQAFLSMMYGPTMAVVLSECQEESMELDTCIDDYNALVVPYNKNLKLIKKLRRACGKKCRKIK